MADQPTPTPSQCTNRLRTKLILCTAMILIIACLLLGGLFVRQQVRSASESSVQSGALLAQHLAQMDQSSIIAGNIPRLNEHIQEILAVRSVAYAAVITPTGDLLAGLGKGVWDKQFSEDQTGRRQFTATTLVRPRDHASMTSGPLSSGIDLKRSGPVLRQNLDLAPSELLAIMVGVELPIFYDITVHVSSSYPMDTEWDNALQLTFTERLDDATENPTDQPTASSLVQVGISTAKLQDNLRRLLWQTLVITMSTLIGGLGLAVWLGRRITIPLQNLTAAAEKLALGETAPTLPVRTRDEIGTLIGVFNHMAMTLQSRERELRELTHSLEDRVTARTEELLTANAKLQDLDRRKSIFVSTTAHELRTPLTSMKVHVANLCDGIDGTVTDDQRQSLGRVEANLSRLQVLIEQLLDLSQIEMGQTTLRIESVAVGSVIARTAEDLRVLASQRRVRILLSLANDLPHVPADPAKLQQIILNLLHNAVKFTKPNTTVEIAALQLPDGHVQISVSDAGPGIALEDAQKVFEPFYRASATRRTIRGTGLGLTITKLLVELHHGRLWLETVPGHGSRFSFVLPNPTTVRSISPDNRVVAHHQPQAI